MPRFFVAAALAVACAACQAAPAQQNSAPPAAAVEPEAEAETATHPVSGLELAPLEIRSGSKVHRFTVEIARTEREQAYGLMNRTKLGPNEGMLFPFPSPRPASFWMKNTLIPLDMIFVRADGSIARIAARTVPHSLEGVAVGEPVAAVLEIAGGRAAELGIDETARVSWPGGPR
ncbi:MAG: DUF192 domain-containing protein [Allosphingosinicella sp.]